MRKFLSLYSKKAWGKFYGVYPHGYWWPNIHGWKGYAIYQRRRTWHGVICIKEKYYKSSNPFHPNCVVGQNKFAAGVSYWHTLSDEGKAIYDSYTHPIQMSGLNRFLHYYLLGLPC